MSLHDLLVYFFLALCCVCVFSRSVGSDSLWPQGLEPTRLLCPWDFPGKNIGVGCHFHLQGIFPNHGSNTGLPHCRQTLYHLSYQGGPRILEWVAYPFSRGSPRPRNRSRVSCIAGGYISGRLECYLIVWMYQILFIHSPTEGYPPS